MSRFFYTYRTHPLYKKKEIQTKDVHQEGLWILNQGRCFRSQVLNIFNYKMGETNIGLKYESGSIETLKRVIDHNSGYNLVPELSIHLDTSKKSVRRFEEPQPLREISIVLTTVLLKNYYWMNYEKAFYLKCLVLLKRINVFIQ